ncbi:MAG: ABC transporter permease [Verrucomicrobiaceae bacterium]
MTVAEPLIIEAGRAEAHYWRDLWRFRDLFYFLAWRDLLVRYKQTAIGVAWALLRPLLTMVIFVVIFTKVAKLPTDGLPAAIFMLGGMLPWQFFSTALSESSSSLITNANLITKIYFPRIIVPASSVIVALVDFLITLILLAVVMLWYSFQPEHYVPSWRLLLLPVFICLSLVAAMGPGLIVTTLNVKFRDFRYVIPFVVQFGIYVSPVGYSSSMIGERFGETARLIYSLNPVVGVIDGFRWCLGGSASLDPLSFSLSSALSLLLLYLGVRYFRKMEKSFADVI